MIDTSDIGRHTTAIRFARIVLGRAMQAEQLAQRRLDELGGITECRSCIRAGIGHSTLLCGRHSAAVSTLRTAARRRVAAQHALADAGKGSP